MLTIHVLELPSLSKEVPKVVGSMERSASQRLMLLSMPISKLSNCMSSPIVASTFDVATDTTMVASDFAQFTLSYSAKAERTGIVRCIRNLQLQLTRRNYEQYALFIESPFPLSFNATPPPGQPH